MKKLLFVSLAVFIIIFFCLKTKNQSHRNPASAINCKSDNDCVTGECVFIDVKTDTKICIDEYDKRNSKNKSDLTKTEEAEMSVIKAIIDTGK